MSAFQIISGKEQYEIFTALYSSLKMSAFPNTSVTSDHTASVTSSWHTALTYSFKLEWKFDSLLRVWRFF